MFLVRVISAAILARPNHAALRQFASKSLSHIDRSGVPRLVESDLAEQFVRGSGPGGQVVNKTANAVVLRHLPTNLVVKCHAGRALHQNRKEARTLMVRKLDNLLNGEQSVEQQELRLQRSKTAEMSRRRRRTDEMKRAWREREEGGGGGGGGTAPVDDGRTKGE